MIAFSCPACRKKLSVKEPLAGKKVRCPACGQTIAVSAAASVQAAVEAAASSGPTDPTGRPEPDRGPTQSGSSQSQATQGAAADAGPTLTDFLAPPQLDDELGRLGGFRILKVLGHGGMGVVFQGEDPRLGRKVAIKAMLPHLAESRSAQERFLREARAAAALEHDHIVAIHHVGEDRGAPFIVMPFLKGESLEARLQRDKLLPVAEVLRIGKEVAGGLAAAHKAGLIHRDIKPTNIWLEGPQARVKILDFGLARAASQDAGLTQPGAIIGTPSYMAPEQASGEAVDARCDLWSLGVVLYRMGTGTLPFRGKDTVSTLLAVAMNEPLAPAEIKPEVPAGLSELVMRLLAKNRDQRIASADEVIQALQELQQCQTHSPDLGMSKTDMVNSAESARRIQERAASHRGEAQGETAKETERGKQQPKTSRLPLYLGLGGILAAAIIAAVVLFRPSPDRDKGNVEGARPPVDPPGKEPEAPGKEPPGVPASGVPISPLALVQRPPPIPGVESWSIETRGHLGPATEPTQLALSSDGVHFATGGDDGTIRIWEPRGTELQLRRILLGHKQKVNLVAWAPDGKMLASVAGDNAVRLWDPSSGKLLRTLTRHTAQVSALAWSADSKTLASGGKDHVVFLWDPATSETRTRFAIHGAPITQILWLSAKTLTSVDSKLGVFVWDAESGNSLQSHVAKPPYAWKADRTVLAYKSGDDEVTFWTLQSGRRRLLKLQGIKGKLTPYSQHLDLSPDGKMLAAEAYSPPTSWVQLWDAESGELISSGVHGDRGINTVAFSPDGKTVASSAGYGVGVRLWKADPGKKESKLEAVGALAAGTNHIWARWSADGKTIYARNGLSLGVYDVTAARAKKAAAARGQNYFLGPAHTVPAHGAGMDVAWAPDSRRLAINDVFPFFTRIWDSDTGQFQRKATARECGWPTAWSPDGTTLAVANRGNTLLCNLEADTPDKVLATVGVRELAWSGDSKQLATAEQKSVRIWDAGAAREVQALPVVAQWLAWSPDQRHLAVVAPGGKVVTLWEANTGQALAKKFAAHEAPIQALAWSPDGLILATGDELGTIRQSSATTGETLKLFQAHEGRVHALAWQDSKTLLSLGGRVLVGNLGGTISFWQTEADKPIRTTRGLPARGRFSPDCKLLAPYSLGDRVFQSPCSQIWDTHTGRLRGTLVFLQGTPDQHLAVSSDGHYRIGGEASRYLAYVVKGPAGQETLSPEEFQTRFAWKNKQEKVRLGPP
jgi:WD40 repeat protein/serine/threonine protein kinase